MMQISQHHQSSNLWMDFRQNMAKGTGMGNSWKCPEWWCMQELHGKNDLDMQWENPFTIHPSIHPSIHSFRSVPFHSIPFHVMSSHFISSHLISHFISFHFISFHFISFHFISFIICVFFTFFILIFINSQFPLISPADAVAVQAMAGSWCWMERAYGHHLVPGIASQGEFQPKQWLLWTEIIQKWSWNTKKIEKESTSQSNPLKQVVLPFTILPSVIQPHKSWIFSLFEFEV